MKKRDMNQFLKKHCQKWLYRIQDNGYNDSEAEMLDHFGPSREDAHRVVAFFAGYSEAVKENEKANDQAGRNGLTRGIAYAAGILNQYHSVQAAEFVLKESGIKSKSELRSAGCEEFDIENIGDILPEE
jgi:hypothetical protein